MTMAHRIAILAGLVVGTVALYAMALPALEGSANAQETAPPAPSATSGSTPAGSSDPAKMEEAKRHFERGLILLRDPDGEKVEPAYLEFKAAHDLSKSPRVLGNIGYC